MHLHSALSNENMKWYFCDISYNGRPIAWCHPEQLHLSSWRGFASPWSADSSLPFAFSWCLQGLKRCYHSTIYVTTWVYLVFSKAVVAADSTSIQPPFDSHSTSFRPRATTIRRPTSRPCMWGCCTAAYKYINRSAWLRLAGCVTVTLMTSASSRMPANGRRIEVES